MTLTLSAKIARSLFFSLALVTVFTFLSCAPFLCTDNAPTSDERNIFPDTIANNGAIEKEITKKEQFIKNNKDPKILARAYLQLASLYSSHRNPSPDYSRAYKLLKEYTVLEPETGRSETIQYWLSVLKAINELQQKNTILMKENRETKEVIEQLKHIDLRIEERRKQVK